MRQRLLLHIGLHKTGTTYLQRHVWPGWEGVGYAGRPNPKGFKSSEEAVLSKTEPVILVSNESSGGSLKQAYLENQSWGGFQRKKLEELKQRFAGNYDLGVIIGLHHPGPWVLSIYKHYLKYGGVESFAGFIGIEDDTPSTLSMEDLSIMPKIQRIEEILGVTPFCFYLEEIRYQPAILSKSLADYAQVEAGPTFNSSATANEGVNDAEAVVCRKINRLFSNRGCLGKGWLKRNKTLGFSFAKKASALGWLDQHSSPLAVSEAEAEYLNARLKSDFEQVSEIVASQRGMPSKVLCQNLRFKEPEWFHHVSANARQSMQSASHAYRAFSNLMLPATRPVWPRRYPACR